MPVGGRGRIVRTHTSLASGWAGEARRVDEQDACAAPTGFESGNAPQPPSSKDEHPAISNDLADKPFDDVGLWLMMFDGVSRTVPVRPTDSAFIEAFNSLVRRECLSQHYSSSLEEGRHVLAGGAEEHNNEWPHGSLGQKTPAQAYAEAALSEDRTRLALRGSARTSPGGAAPADTGSLGTAARTRASSARPAGSGSAARP